MVHPDGTMDVRINGQIARRPIDKDQKPHGYMNTSKQFPIKLPGEMVLWTLDSDVPYILKGVGHD